MRPSPFCSGWREAFHVFLSAGLRQAQAGRSLVFNIRLGESDHNSPSLTLPARGRESGREILFNYWRSQLGSLSGRVRRPPVTPPGLSLPPSFER